MLPSSEAAAKVHHRVSLTTRQVIVEQCFSCTGIWQIGKIKHTNT